MKVNHWKKFDKKAGGWRICTEYVKKGLNTFVYESEKVYTEEEANKRLSINQKIFNNRTTQNRKLIKSTIKKDKS